MKKRNRILAIILSVVMALTIIPLSLFASAEDFSNYKPFVDENGKVNTKEGKYKISSYDELIALMEEVNAGNSYTGSTFAIVDFKVPNENGEMVPLVGTVIDFSDSKDSWKPIGKRNNDTNSTPFSGTFDGNGYTISGLNFGDPTSHGERTASSTAFFGYVKGGTIKNLAVANSKFYVGGLGEKVAPIAAYVENTNVVNCAVMDDVVIDVLYNTNLPTNNVYAGLVATSVGSTIDGCYSNAQIIINSTDDAINKIGGLVGNNAEGSVVSNSYFNGSATTGLSDKAFIGGIVGANEGTIKNCYNVGMITGKTSAAIAGVNVGALADPKNPDSAFVIKGKLENCLYYYDSALAGSYDQVKNGDNYSLKATVLDANLVPFHSALDGFTTSKLLTDKINASLTAGSFAPVDSAKDISTLISENKYPFPVIKAIQNMFPMKSLVENTTDYAGGSGAVYDPFEVSTTDHLENVRKNLNKAFVVTAEITFPDPEPAVSPETEVVPVTFDPIGTNEVPFMGMFDGGNKNISNIHIVGDKEAALFVRNVGTIKNIKIGAHKDPEGDYKPSTVVVTNVDASASSAAAAIAVYNDGIIKEADTNVDVTTITENFKTSVGGVTAVNRGTIDTAKNAGIIFADFTDAAYQSLEAEPEKVATGMAVSVGGVAAINEKNATVKNCGHNSSARSEIEAGSTLPGVKSSSFIAKNATNATTTGADVADNQKAYLEYKGPKGADYDYTLPELEYSENSLTSPEIIKGAVLHPITADQVTGTAKYSPVKDNYQHAEFTFTRTVDGATQTYTSHFLAWLKLNISGITVDYSKADKDYIEGEIFSSANLSVQTQNGIKLHEVKNEKDTTGYVVKLYSDEACTPQNEIADLSKELVTTKEPRTIYVKLLYNGQKIPATTTTEYTYTIKLHGINGVQIKDTESSVYMVGQAPKLDIKALYSDGQSTMPLKPENYVVMMGLSKDKMVESSTFTEAHANKTVFVAVKYVNKTGNSVNYEILSNIIEIKVLPSDVVITGKPIVKTSDNDPNVTASNIKLEWNDTHNLKYKIERQENSGEWEDMGTVSKPTFTDTQTNPGENYTYRIYTIVAGTQSSGKMESDKTMAPVPVKFEIKTKNARKYTKLYSEFDAGAIDVKGIYNNGTTKFFFEAKDKETARHAGFYLDTSKLKVNEVGTYTIGVMYWHPEPDPTGTVKQIGSFETTVVAPERLEATAKYENYPTEYDKEKFDNTLSVIAFYPQYSGLSSYRVHINTPEKTGFTTNYEPQKDAKKPYVVTVSYPSFDNKTLKAKNITTTVSVNIVPNVAPDKVDATAQLDGSIKVSWSAVEGAEKYYVYRATGALPIIYWPGPTIVAGEKENMDANGNYFYIDEGVAPGEKYTYRIVPYFAGEKGPMKRSKIGGATPIAPQYIKAVFNENFDKELASKQAIDLKNVDVYAYYSTTNSPLSLDAAGFNALKPEKNDKYTYRRLAKNKDKGKHAFFYKSDYNPEKYDKAIKEYAVSITYKGDENYNGKPIGASTFTVYPVFELQVTANKYNFAKGSEFTPNAFNVTAIYGKKAQQEGEENKIVAEKLIGEKTFKIENAPNMNQLGKQIVTVVLKDDESIRKDVEINVFDETKILTFNPNDTFVRSDDGYVKNIQPKTRMADLRFYLVNPDENVVVYDKNGNVTNRVYVATGDTVKLEVNGAVEDSFIIVVRGDLNNDGIVDGFDTRKILNAALLDNVTLSAPNKLAANINNDAEIDGSDYRKAINYAAGFSKDLV